MSEENLEIVRFAYEVGYLQRATDVPRTEARLQTTSAFTPGGTGLAAASMRLTR